MRNRCDFSGVPPGFAKRFLVGLLVGMGCGYVLPAQDATALLRLRYTRLPSRADVRLDGVEVGRLDEEFSPNRDGNYVELRVKNLEDTPHAQFKMLTLDFEDEKNDDFHVFVPLRVGEENPGTISISLPEIQPLSFHYRRNIFESAPHLVAGDPVTFIANDAAEHYDRLLWLAVPGIEEKGEESSDSQVSSLVLTEHDYGAFLAVRNIIRRQLAGGRDAEGDDASNLLFSRKAGEQIDFRIGQGRQVAWTPEIEGQVRIYLIGRTKGEDKRWMVVSRLFDIVDVRPTVWLRPRLISHSDAEEMEYVLRDANRINRFSPLQHSYLIYQAFEKMTYEAEINSPVVFDVIFGPFLNAQIPVESLTLRTGDQEKQLPTEETTFRHTFTNLGTNQVEFVVRDIHGLERRQTLQVNVIPKRVADREGEEGASVVKEHFGDVFWLLNRTMADWAADVADLPAPLADNRGLAVSISHPDNLNLAPDHENDAYGITHVHPDLTDLIDHHLVDALRDRGCRILERDEGWVAAANGTRLDGKRPQLPSPDKLLLYKLKQAKVDIKVIGPIAFRRVKLLALVRVVDPQTLEVSANRMVNGSASDFTVDREYLSSDPRTMDAYSEGYLQDVRVSDTSSGGASLSFVGLTEEERAEQRRRHATMSDRIREIDMDDLEGKARDAQKAAILIKGLMDALE